MKKLRRMQNINNIVMTLAFMATTLSIFTGAVIGIVFGVISLICTFIAEKKIERARRIFLSSDPITNVLHNRG